MVKHVNVFLLCLPKKIIHPLVRELNYSFSLEHYILIPIVISGSELSVALNPGVWGVQLPVFSFTDTPLRNVCPLYQPTLVQCQRQDSCRRSDVVLHLVLEISLMHFAYILRVDMVPNFGIMK